MSSPKRVPRSPLMRRAAARAARRRGSRRRMRPFSASPASKRANGTRVVLPAPVGACKTRQLRSCKLATISGSNGSMGRGSNADPLSLPGGSLSGGFLPGGIRLGALFQFQRGGINAETLVRRRRAVVEHVAQMGVATAAHHFGAAHEETVVREQGHVVVGNRLPKAGPTRA